MANFYYQNFIITSIYTRILFRCNPTPRKHEGCLPVGFFVNLTPLLVIWGLKKFFEASLIVKNDRLARLLLASLDFKMGHQACPAHWRKPLKQQSCFMAIIVYNYTLSCPERKLASKKDKQKELVFLRTSPFY
ncbi:hypothetical protein [Leuconostoc mesenteroides]|uniref:hypothetical protein n=2 Tax=Leuconostoc TaxID=1243 RepID=UPI003866959A